MGYTNFTMRIGSIAAASYLPLALMALPHAPAQSQDLNQICKSAIISVKTTQDLQKSTLKIVQSCIAQAELVQLKRLIVQRQADLPEDAERNLELLLNVLQITRGAFEAHVHIIQKTETPNEELAQRLVEKALEHQKLLEHIGFVDVGDPERVKLRDLALAAANRGLYDEAKDILRKAGESDASDLDQPIAVSSRRIQSKAAALAGLGRIASIQTNHMEAARHFGVACELVPNVYADQRREYRAAAGHAFYRQGNENGDVKSLRQSVQVYKVLLGLTARAPHPQEWAKVQDDLGNALLRLGARLGSKDDLEQAAHAFQEALNERRRDQVAAEWAQTQTNLGIALFRLGVHQRDAARLEASVTAFRDALLEVSEENEPEEWAALQNNLGTVLWNLGARTDNIETLEQSVEAFHNALKNNIRTIRPLDWAARQNNLGAALSALGEREKGTLHYEQAIQAFHISLQAYREASAIYFIEGVKKNLARAEELLAKRMTSM